MTVREFDLKPGTTWPVALSRVEELIELVRSETGATGPALDPTPSFKLDEHGKPTHCLVRLSTPLDPPPAGWVTRLDRPGLAVVLAGLDQLNTAAIELLQSRAPAGGPRGTPYCRILRQSGPRGIQLYLPLDSESP